MRLTIYARVSDTKLKEDGSRRQDVQRQIEHLMPYIEGYSKSCSEEVIVVPPFIDDGKSAFKEDYQARPAFCGLLREIKAHRVQRVYVESLDRWSRRVTDGLTTLKDASDAGATIVSIAEGEIDWTTPQGWFKSLIALGMAEWASREKSWRVKQGMQRSKEKGIHVGRPSKLLNR